MTQDHWCARCVHIRWIIAIWTKSSLVAEFHSSTLLRRRLRPGYAKPKSLLYYLAMTSKPIVPFVLLTTSIQNPGLECTNSGRALRISMCREAWIREDGAHMSLLLKYNESKANVPIEFYIDTLPLMTRTVEQADGDQRYCRAPRVRRTSHR